MTAQSKPHLKLSVLIVDESFAESRVFSDYLANDASISLVETAGSHIAGREKVVSQPFDALILDAELGGEEGLSFLRYLMRSHPVPVIVLCSLSPKGIAVAIEALSLGAVDILPKPGAVPHGVQIGDLVLEKVKVAAATTKFSFARPNTAVISTLIARLERLQMLCHPKRD